MKSLGIIDLEFDYINPYDSATRINQVILPEFITQAGLCLFFLVTGHWFMSLLCVPYLYYNVKIYLCQQIFCLIGHVKLINRISVCIDEIGLHNHSIYRCLVKSLPEGVFDEMQSLIQPGYMGNQHLVDVTEIFNQLNWEKKKRLFKLGYNIFILFLSLFWLIWSTLDDDEPY
ncbi:hypothetical protein Cgig2_017272 [Carnegiea gigantea]|uniref:Uncharacterized protein n=1 Tax=Carnegiea gigantea TaxID=171969 RepID=A0A9Q1QJH3_9CARY|nr:hypothetical protein Cgig2_017272 [Carnegiea gigantea]